MRKPGNTCVTDHHDMTLVVKVALNPNTNNQPNNKILDMSKLKALNFADNKLNIVIMTISLFDRVENTVGKGENAGYQHFLLSDSVFLSLHLEGH